MKNELSEKTNRIIEEMRSTPSANSAKIQEWATALEDELVSNYTERLNNWLEAEKNVKEDASHANRLILCKILNEMTEELTKRLEDCRQWIEWIVEEDKNTDCKLLNDMAEKLMQKLEECHKIIDWLVEEDKKADPNGRWSEHCTNCGK